MLCHQLHIIYRITGKLVQSDSSANSVTNKCEIFEMKDTFWDQMKRLSNSFTNSDCIVQSLKFVDTPGWDDSGEKLQDNEIFRNIFRFLRDQGITHIRAIVWTINPEIRMTAGLQRQGSSDNTPSLHGISFSA